MKLATQVSKLPTNKLLTGSIGAPLIGAAWQDFWSSIWPVLATDSISTLAGVGIAIGIGYFIPDGVNKSQE